jgi:RNA polymerase sigma factor (TIGR02999 family)
MDQLLTTRLLGDARGGDRDASDRLFAHVHEELRRIAEQRLRRHRRGETLSTTELMQEVYLRLVDLNQADPGARAHFFALASRALRFILVDYARDRLERQRDAEAAGRPPDAVRAAASERATDVLALHEALEVLSRQNERLGRMVEYRFFGGLSYEEIAEVVGCPVPTVKREWNRARAWLYRTMHPVEV